MAEKLKTGFAVLEATATSAQSGSGTEGPDFVRIGSALDGLQVKMTDWTERIQAQLTVTAARVEEVASTSGVFHQEAQLQFQLLKSKYTELAAAYQSAGPAPAPASTMSGGAVDPMAGGNGDWSRFLGKGGAPFGGQAQRVSIATPPTFDPPRVNGRWAFYDEKYIMIPGVSTNKFDTKSTQSWPQSTPDYVAGRTSELDPVLDWVEAQTEPISLTMLMHPNPQRPIPMVDAAGSLGEVARQLWAMLNPLLAGDSDKATMSANVQRHNGIEAWRRLAEPINEDKAMVRRDLLAAVTNPKGASSIEKIELAIEE